MIIKKIEEELKSHVVFIYNNIELQDSAIIDSKMVQELAKIVNGLNDYDSITLVLNTRGGNLASGYKIINILKEKYRELNIIVMEMCGSTGTFMALASDHLYASSSAMITPTEPQMQIYDGSGEIISTSVIRNYIENSNYQEKIEKLDAITYGNYISTILYFKNLCYNIYTKDRAEKVLDFMLKEVNSHQQPLIKKDFEKMGVELLTIPKSIVEYLEEAHKEIICFIQDKTKNHTRHTLIRTADVITAYEKRYAKDKHKIAEGYFIIEEDEFMKKQNNQNGRVADIMRDVDAQIITTSGNYQDATAAHWDSYNDSRYHDKYDDHYDDYGDNSIYHDCYKDSTLVDAPKAKIKRPSEVRK